MAKRCASFRARVHRDSSATFYFDKESGLLVRMVRYTNSAVGRVPTQIDYSDYRPVAGVMMPFKWSYAWVSGREEFAMTDIQPNVAVDRGQVRQARARQTSH